jgi:hypothetical protein
VHGIILEIVSDIDKNHKTSTFQSALPQRAGSGEQDQDIHNFSGAKDHPDLIQSRLFAAKFPSTQATGSF